MILNLVLFDISTYGSNPDVMFVVQMIPNTDYEFEKWEHVTACKNVILAYEGDRSGLRGYICVATIFT